MRTRFRIEKAEVGFVKNPTKNQKFGTYQVLFKSKDGWTSIGGKFTDVITANNYIHKFMSGKTEDKRPDNLSMKWTTEL